MPKSLEHLPLPIRRVVERSRAGKVAADAPAKPASPEQPNKKRRAPPATKKTKSRRK